MSLEPDQERADVSSKAGAGAPAMLREIHQLLETQRIDQVRGQRLAGIVSALAVSGIFCFYLVSAVLNAYPTREPGQVFHEFVYVTVLSLLTAVPLAAAYHLRYSLHSRLTRHIAWSFVIAVVSGGLVTAFATLASPTTSCGAGRAAAAGKNQEQAVRAYSWCLAFPTLTESARAQAYRGRAAAHALLGQPAEAVADYEAGFKVQPPASKDDHIRFAAELVVAGRFEDALNAAKRAESLSPEGPTPQTAYLRGRALVGLKRFPEAIDAYTLSITAQRFYPYWYWYRALAYEAAGNEALARKDLEASANLMLNKIVDRSKWEPLPGTVHADEMTAQIRKKLQDYGLDKKYPL